MKLNIRLSLIFSLCALLILTTSVYSFHSTKFETDNTLESHKESFELSNSATESESETSSAEALKKKHKKFKLSSRKKSTNKQLPTPFSIGNVTDSLQNSTYRNMNITYISQELNEFKAQNRKWDYQLYDKQFEEIYKTMLLRQMSYKTLFGDRAYMEIFLNYFHSCDKDFDNVLNFEEFKNCMSTDSYLARIKPPKEMYAAQKNYTQSEVFYKKIFETLDTHHTDTINFFSYMELRLFIFSWRKCSVVGPFIEETSWECAINIISGLKTPSRSTLRNTFYMCLEISNSYTIRNIDFISFIIFANSARLYGKINGKTDGDVTKNEFNLMLDENMLPAKYNQDIVNNFFKLTYEDDHESEGMDFQTFVYYDFALGLYDQRNATRRWFLNETEFTEAISNPLFNVHMMTEIEMIPTTNYTNVSKIHF